MSKKHKRGPITTFKPQPPIYSCNQGRICEEVKDLRARLEMQRLDTECYKRLYNTSLNDNLRLTRNISCLKEQLEKTGIALTTTDEALTAYRRAYRRQRDLNVVLAVVLAISTILHLINIFCK